MSLVSYAQNFEDVMLWRALRHVENGTYVDIGAQDPVVDSVSKAFYEQGWRGVHIEPVPYYADRLRQDRPDEIVLEAALGAVEGTLTLNVIAGTGLSTAVDVHANRHHEAGFTAQQVVVPMLTLGSALHMLASREVHWLKIDVEGYEKQVLLGWNSTVLRPWILVIEATIPGSSETDYEDWEPLVLAADYQFVYFDGLNRFFVAREHPELLTAFNAPPNVFDDFQMSGQGSWGLFNAVEARRQAASDASRCESEAAMQVRHEILLAQLTAEVETMRSSCVVAREEAVNELNRLQAQADAVDAERLAVQHVLLTERKAAKLHSQALNTRFVKLQEQVLRLDEQNEALQKRVMDGQAQTHEWWSVADRLSKEVIAMHASSSWRLTQPLRNMTNHIRRLRHLPARSAHAAKTKARAAARTIVVGSLRTVLAQPRARVRLSRLLERHPGLKQALRRIAGRAGLIQGIPATVSPTAVAPIDSIQSADVAKRTMRIYVQLKNIQNGKS